jgi:hypothetical protein
MKHDAAIDSRTADLELERAVALELLAYCESREWAGVDPYDGLNSKIFQALPVLDRRLPRLLLTQALKRSPINIRPLLRVPPTQNPKALGLFLMSLLKFTKLGLLNREDQLWSVVERLEALRSRDTSYWCWGYSFAWQTRTLLVPRGFPNLVCTTFVANALLDAYKQTGESRFLVMACSAAEYLLNELYWTDGGSVAGFGYPLPSMRNNIHNGNFLGAALFCRVGKETGEGKFIEPALRVARYSASRQKQDGSWAYGEAPSQEWVDNFHTGYNLCALRSIARDLETPEFDSCVRRGFEFYRSHFFLKDGTPKYFHDRTYPIDIHCVAQSIITLLEFKDLDPTSLPLARSVLSWAIKYMWDARGFFYYRKLRTCTIRTSYMRWSQAWMLLAISSLLCESEAEAKRSHTDDSLSSLKAKVC